MTEFHGRNGERAQLEQLLDRARRGESAVLVVRGEAGIGKTAFLRWVADHAPGFRVAHVTGVEAELELAYAGLHQLCAPLIARLAELPTPQRVALEVALGLAAGDPPDRFLVGLAVLSLLSATAEEQPLLCIVDDLPWLDDASANVLGFVARRLLAEPIALVFAVREPSPQRHLTDLPELWLDGLDEGDARALLATVIPGRIDERVRERILAETRGNPLAMLELPRDVSPTEPAGGLGADALSSGVEDEFRRRIAALPDATRRLLQLAAADPVGDPLLVWRAAERLGIDRHAAQLAAEAGLLEIGAQVRFRHPLVRSAAYASAPVSQRHTLHAALAEATDPNLDPDRHAWHRAQAVVGLDEDVARELERSAERAQARGGLAAAAAFLDRAATITPDPARRVHRLLVAARTLYDAGQLEEALGRLVAVESTGAGAPEVEHLRGQVAFDRRQFGEAAQLLLSSARRSTDRMIYLEALSAAIWADDPDAIRAAAEEARRLPPGTEPQDLLLDGLAVRLTDGAAAGAPPLRAALEAVLALEPAPGRLGEWLWLTGLRGAGTVALELADADAAHTLASRQVQVAREHGALVQLQFALNFVARTHILRGELAAAEVALDEERRIATATRRPPIGYTAMGLAAWRGQEGPATEVIASASGRGRVANIADHAAAVLWNGLGRYDLARDAAQRAFARDQLTYRLLIAPDLAEAASRTGDTALLGAAREALDAAATPTDWLLGMRARVRALAGGGDEAERHYRESLDRLQRTSLRGELARSRLLYGEWLRREGRRVDAREQLRVARETLMAIGADGFADRARHELLATGEKVRKRRDDTRDELTPQEAQIARLARDGRTNPQIGAELFLSPRTVEWHLKKVFTKLGISSRRALRDALPDRDLAYSV